MMISYSIPITVFPVPFKEREMHKFTALLRSANKESLIDNCNNCVN